MGMANDDTDVVCIVDDDESLRRSLRNLLSSVGYQVATFDSAEAFLGSEQSERPCCLILDLRMPGIGGLPLLHHLTTIASGHRVIVLTGHGDAETRRRALRTGAIAFLEKPFESDELLDAVQGAASASRPARAAVSKGEPPKHVQTEVAVGERPIELAGGTLDDEFHICAFFNGPDEEHRVLRSFVIDGLDRGERSLHIVGSEQRDEHLQWLRDEGIDIEQAMATGQLEVRLWDDSYLGDDGFDMDRMLRHVEEILRSDVAAGRPPTRVVAHMEWALLDKPGVEDLVEYEARADAMLRKYRAPVICAYDLTKFGASVVMDVLRTHPMVIIGGVLQENPFFVPPGEFLREIRARESERDVTITS
jgi:FixJ family two-component response regulator